MVTAVLKTSPGGDTTEFRGCTVKGLQKRVTLSQPTVDPPNGPYQDYCPETELYGVSYQFRKRVGFGFKVEG